MNKRLRFAIGLTALLLLLVWGLGTLLVLHAKQIRYALVVADKPIVWHRHLQLTQPGYHTVTARMPFTIEGPATGPLVISSDHDMESWTLDGQSLAVPFPAMHYRTLTAVPSPAPGTHMLQGTWDINVPQGDAVTVSASIEVREQTDQDLAITSGPIVTQLTGNSFTVTCRTTLPVAADLQVGDRDIPSPAGLIHRFRVDGLGTGQAQRYLITAQSGERRARTGPYEVRTLPADGPLVFAVAGDSRSNPKVWGRIANDILAYKPNVFLHTGDYVGFGRIDALWEQDFCAPARDLLASSGICAVPGNHEQHAPLFRRLFPTPSGSENWSQQIGPMLLIGIDGADTGWAPAEGQPGPRTQWLEGIIRDSTSPYILVLSHYPPRSSGTHGDNEVGSEIILPLLQRYHTTGMICGHDHSYERSEPAAGTSIIVAGGGGAPLHKASHPNPDSKVFKSVHSYAILRVDQTSCVMNAYDIDNNPIDARTWEPRPESSH